jgi:Glycosyl hydrolase catalytic core
MDMTHKNLIIILLVGAVACKKSGSAPAPPGTDSTNTSTSKSPATNSKKGADFSTNMTDGEWNGDIVHLKPFWFYTWGTPLPGGAPSNCEFVPMFWGAGNVTAGNISTVQQLKAQGAVKYVLGFNEPDQSGQSNMTVSQALALWPQLESIGLPLGSPAVSWPTLQWFTDFMDSVQAEHLRVDFICVHMYVGTDDASFVQTLQQVYNQYHLPVWITEFATADWNATTPSGNQYTAADAMGFMQRLLPQLDTLSFVQRYSWFSGDPNSAQLWPSALIAVNGSLTPLGSWYANYQANTQVKL